MDNEGDEGGHHGGYDHVDERLMVMTMNNMIKIILEETLSKTIKSNAPQKGAKKLDKAVVMDGRLPSFQL